LAQAIVAQASFFVQQAVWSGACYLILACHDVRHRLRCLPVPWLPMCSFLVANFLLANVTILFNALMRLRGPDATTRVRLGGLEFIHNLLHLTGPLTRQPLLDEGAGTVVVFNGEIYNHGSLAAEIGTLTDASDASVLLPAYKRWGPELVRRLDGEFALAIVDFTAGQALLASDAFGTKPLWLWRDEARGQWAAASYRSALSQLGLDAAELLGPNTALVCELPALRPCRRFRPWRFDLRQFKESKSDWRTAFSNAVGKRAGQGADGPRPSVFLGLSSGHDSGAIHAELLRQRRPHAAYVVLGPEDLRTVKSRAAATVVADESEGWAASAVLSPSLEQYIWEREWLRTYAEPYQRPDSGAEGGYAALDNPASMGLSMVCREAAASGRRAMLSGQGADETMTNYGDRGQSVADYTGQQSFEAQQDFAGLYPTKLEEVFPWANFFRGANQDFLQTIEAVCDAHGVEARYPFLDLAVVQEWLWLTPEAKNAAYKGPVEELLASAGYPYLPGTKAGFGAKQGVDTTRWRGYAWDYGGALGRDQWEDNLPPPFVAVGSELFSERNESTVCNQLAPAMLADVLRTLWFQAASHGRADILEVLLGRCCYQVDFTEREASDCAAAVLNARDVRSEETSLATAVRRGDVLTARALRRFACGLPEGGRRNAVLLAAMPPGTAGRLEAATPEDDGESGVLGAFWSCEDISDTEATPSPDAPMAPLVEFAEIVIETLADQGQVFAPRGGLSRLARESLLILDPALDLDAASR